MKYALRLACLLLCLAGTAAGADDGIVVGSKKFTESVVLGELLTRRLAADGIASRHRRELGGTRVLWEALKRGDISVYPEYSGTLAQELLGLGDATRADIEAALEPLGLRMSGGLGFSNNYALAMPAEQAERLGITRISELTDKRATGLRYGFSHEFLDRADGWPGLSQAYGFPAVSQRGLDHDIAYRALEEGAVDVIEVYTTDAEIAYYDLRVLEDDRQYFQDYAAVWLYRRDLPASARALVTGLTDVLRADDMRALNAAVKLDGRTEAAVATDFLRHKLDIEAAPAGESEPAWARFKRTTAQHLFLVGLSLLAAIVVALPLGVLAASYRPLRQPVLAAVGILQTIPSLALLVIMVPLLGIGAAPAIVALFLYSLLPIVRNTVTGLTGIPPAQRDSARALGLTPAARLRLIYLPLALPQILAGIKIAAVINVGTATLAALIGAGGYGEPILTGIRLDSTALILWGALPAAGMALAVQGLFDLIERLLVSPGLRH